MMSAQPKTARKRQRRPVPGALDRSEALNVLEYFLETLVLLHEAYLILYPTRSEHHSCGHGPPVHVDSSACPHASEMIQSERMVFIGLLLRTTNHIQMLDSQAKCTRQDFAHQMQELKRDHPEMVRGVALLDFLTASVCCNNEQTLNNLLHLVKALKKSGETCRHAPPPVMVAQYYNDVKNNCTLTLINALLSQCEECEGSEEVQTMRRKLQADLDPTKWHGCGDCELILLDILMYARMLPRANCRMLASLRLSFDYTIDLSQVHDRDETLSTARDLFIEGIDKIVPKLGLARFKKMPILQDGSHNMITRSMEGEVMFISGRQEMKKEKDDLQRLLEEILRYKWRRTFYIQWKYLRFGQGKWCCENQILSCLQDMRNYFPDLQLKLRTHAALNRFVLPTKCTVTAHMILEQDPCGYCQENVMPELHTLLNKWHPECALHVFSLLRTPSDREPYRTFLERLTNSTDYPVLQLKDDLKPFENRHVCLVNFHDSHAHDQCKFVRCIEQCQYSAPNNVLAVRELRCFKFLIWYKGQTIYYRWTCVFHHIIGRDL